MIRSSLKPCQRLPNTVQVLRGTSTTASRAPRAIPRSKPGAPPPSSEPSPKPASRVGHILRASNPAETTVFWTFNLFVVGHLFVEYVGFPAYCTGPSMLPTLSYSGDWVFVSRLHAKLGWIKVGDLVSFHHPVRRGVHASKRLIGMPGDFVLRDTPGTGSAAMVRVPPGHCWVVGDNLNASRDSRMFGALPLELVRGKVLFRFWPTVRVFGGDLTEPVIVEDD